MFQIKRAYMMPAPDDGLRVLVDRLWPRGLAKDKANIDLWLKEIAPSSELRQWFSHDPKKWAEFAERYLRELALPERQSPLERLRSVGRENVKVTLLFGARDRRHNHALLLCELLNRCDCT
jgi:uncharacterized protein YeaO (DUF488 family)